MPTSTTRTVYTALRRFARMHRGATFTVAIAPYPGRYPVEVASSDGARLFVEEADDANHAACWMAAVRYLLAQIVRDL